MRLAVVSSVWLGLWRSGSALQTAQPQDEFTSSQCETFAKKVKESGRFTEEAILPICETDMKSMSSKCDFIAEVFSLASSHQDFNSSRFCFLLEEAHFCSKSMDHLLASEAVSDLAYGECIRAERKKDESYCKKFQNMLGTAVATDDLDTLRACYMIQAYTDTKDTKEGPKPTEDAPQVRIISSSGKELEDIGTGVAVTTTTTTTTTTTPWIVQPGIVVKPDKFENFGDGDGKLNPAAARKTEDATVTKTAGGETVKNESKPDGKSDGIIIQPGSAPEKAATKAPPPSIIVAPIPADKAAAKQIGAETAAIQPAVQALHVVEQPQAPEAPAAAAYAAAAWAAAAPQPPQAASIVVAPVPVDNAAAKQIEAETQAQPQQFGAAPVGQTQPQAAAQPVAAQQVAVQPAAPHPVAPTAPAASRASSVVSAVVQSAPAIQAAAQPVAAQQAAVQPAQPAQLVATPAQPAQIASPWFQPFKPAAQPVAAQQAAVQPAQPAQLVATPAQPAQIASPLFVPPVPQPVVAAAPAQPVALAAQTAAALAKLVATQPVATQRAVMQTLAAQQRLSLPAVAQQVSQPVVSAPVSQPIAKVQAATVALPAQTPVVAQMPVVAQAQQAVAQPAPVQQVVLVNTAQQPVAAQAQQAVVQPAPVQQVAQPAVSAPVSQPIAKVQAATVTQPAVSPVAAVAQLVAVFQPVVAAPKVAPAANSTAQMMIVKQVTALAPVSGHQKKPQHALAQAKVELTTNATIASRSAANATNSKAEGDKNKYDGFLSKFVN